jgi:hypothetical protein
MEKAGDPESESPVRPAVAPALDLCHWMQGSIHSTELPFSIRLTEDARWPPILCLTVSGKSADTIATIYLY